VKYYIVFVIIIFKLLSFFLILLRYSHKLSCNFDNPVLSFQRNYFMFSPDVHQHQLAIDYQRDLQ